MSYFEIKPNKTSLNYKIVIGKNILKFLPKEINKKCPNVKKIAIIIDKNVPSIFEKNIKKILKKYKIFTIKILPSEKNKSIYLTNKILEDLLEKKFNRSDLIISVGGGIVGDISGFVASILKRGTNFINIPTTLLSQVDSSVGGKTGVNSRLGKNLVGSFYQPKLVLSDINFLSSLPKREIVCGYAEILKHAIIKDIIFFKWLKNFSNKVLIEKNPKSLSYAIFKSCKIKLSFVTRDVKEKNLRMSLNFGHTFAHAIEAKNNYSGKINHGEAVLIGIILATKLSILKKVCSINALNEINQIYKKNNLNYILSKFDKDKNKNQIFKFMKNDKKNNDEKINFILLKKIGQTYKPGMFKIDSNKIKKIFNRIS